MYISNSLSVDGYLVCLKLTASVLLFFFFFLIASLKFQNLQFFLLGFFTCVFFLQGSFTFISIKIRFLATADFFFSFYFQILYFVYLHIPIPNILVHIQLKWKIGIQSSQPLDCVNSCWQRCVVIVWEENMMEWNLVMLIWTVCVCVVLAALGAIFGMTTCLTAQAREAPNDPLNYFIGGCASGAFLGARSKY